jgi:hypothetical protein
MYKQADLTHDGTVGQDPYNARAQICYTTTVIITRNDREVHWKDIAKIIKERNKMTGLHQSKRTEVVYLIK